MNSNGVGQAPPESHEYQHRVGQSAGAGSRLVNHRRASFSPRHDFERNVGSAKSVNDDVRNSPTESQSNIDI